jgi:hypothetical protein
MKNNKKTVKAIALSLVLAAGMLLPASGFAQEGGGLFGRGNVDESNGWFSNLFRLDDPNVDGEITNDDFGAPLGSGIVVLLGTGLGYVALKKKEDEQ